MNRRALWLCVLLALAAAVLGAPALGEEIIASAGIIEEEMLPDVLPDSETLRDGYAGQVLFPSNLVGRNAYSSRYKLTESERAVYDALRDAVIEIANGQRASSAIELPVESTGLACWYLDELDGTFVDGETGAVDMTLLRSAIREQMQQRFDPVKIARSLMLDESFNFYWMDVRKAYKYISPWNLPMYVEDDGDGRLRAVIEGNLRYRFPVDALYLDESCDPAEPYSVNTDKSGAALAAAENARAIVNETAGVGDLERMTLYMQAIRALTSYNHDAVDPSYSDASPWQIVWVFDGDPETKVVCEGYSKAFQYLCGLTDFDDADIEVYSVTGKINGAHMWNIVRYAGENYLVDITNCNTDGGRTDSLFFSIPRSGDVENGYLMVRQGSSSSIELLYVYNERATSVYTESELTLSMTAPEDIVEWGSVGALLWNLRKDGRLCVKGSGALAEAAFAGRTDVRCVEIQRGVTSVAADAFRGCDAFDTLYLPAGLGEIGDSAFADCAALGRVVFGGTRKEAKAIAIGAGNDALLNAEWVYEGDMPIDLDNYQVLYLPQALESVEEEAFAGVTAEVVVLPAGEISIGSRAFADCAGLLYVVVSEGTVLHAAEDALAGSDVIVLYP